MGRPKTEATRPRSLRLPIRLWDLLERAARDQGIRINQLLWRVAEDWLVANRYLKEKDRRRPGI